MKKKAKRTSITDEQSKSVLADYHTSQYTQRELAEKHKLGLASINKIVKGITSKTYLLAERVIKANEANEENKIEVANSETLEHARIVIEATLENIKGLKAKIKTFKTANDHRVAQETLDRASLTIGMNKRHANQNIAILNQTTTKGLNDFYSEIKAIDEPST